MVLLGVLLGVGGCGGEGAASDALLRVYVSGDRGFCDAARAALERGGGRGGDFRVRAVCLDDGEGGRWRLAAVGANARRATEDTASVAYLGEPDPAAARFSRPILATAGIAQVVRRSGGAAMSAVLRALEEVGGSEDPRADVAGALGQ